MLLKSAVVLVVITDVCFLFEKSPFGWNRGDSASGLLKTVTGRKSAAILIFQCVIVDVVSSMVQELAQTTLFVEV